jgi:ABC-type glycerol-3-phosphate transport system substrate-binding protein
MTDIPASVNRRRFLQLGALGAASAALAACSSNSSSGTGATTSAGSTSAGDTASGTTGSAGVNGSAGGTTSGGAAPTGAKTRIQLMGLFFLADEVAAAKQIINDFNAQSTTVQVEYVQQSWGTIDSKMTVAFSSGDVPDLFHYYDSGLVPWGENGLLTDLKTLMPASTWTNIIPGTLTSLTSPTKGVLGLPFETETPLVYYNTDVFAAHNITPATLANRWTWDDLTQTAIKLTDPSKKMTGVSANWHSSEILFKNGLAWQAGAAPIVHNDVHYSINANDPGTKSAIEFIANLFANKAADPNGLGSADVVAAFMTGASAMLIRGAWARTQIPTVKGANVKWKTMPMIQGTSQNLGSGAAQTLSIPAAAKNKEAAAEFLAFWAKPENVAKINQASGQLPPDTQALDILKTATAGQEGWEAAIAEATDLHGQPYCPGWLGMLGKVWDPPMINIFKGTGTYDQFASTVNKNGTDAVEVAAGNK